MAGKSEIEWTEHTWNPLVGCEIKSPGCKKCYAMRLAKRLAAMGNKNYEGLTKESAAGAVWTGVIRRAPKHTLLEPLRRRKPTMYFVNSMSDLFYEEAPDEWIDEIFAVMALCPQHTFQVLTKRADRMLTYMTKPDLARGWAKHVDALKPGFPIMEWPLPNVWLGVSTERQQEANERIPLLLQTPAAVRFISAEPLLGPIDLKRLHREGLNGSFVDNALDGFVSNGCGGHHGPALDWVIVGGESGHGHREMDPMWAKAIIADCLYANVPVFMKQMAGRAPIPQEMAVRQFPRRAA